MCDKTEDRVPPWRTLVYNYTQDATIHGIRFITLFTPYWTRRILWFLIVATALTLLIFLNINNLVKYYNYPTSVSVTVKNVVPLTFPAVTICNYNPYRLTGLVDIGLFDPVWSYYQRDDGDEKKDTFTYIEGLCIYSEEEKDDLFLNKSGSRKAVYNFVSELACEEICVHLESTYCSGIIYNRTAKSCEITSAVFDEGDAPQPVSPCSLQSLEYYRRNIYIKTFSTQCDWEGSGQCDISYQPHIYGRGDGNEEGWLRKQAKDSLIKWDHTLGTENGYHVYMKPAYRTGTKGILETSKMLLKDSCLELYYFVYGKQNATVSVYVKDEELRVTAQRQFHDANVTHWKRIFMELPDGIMKIVIAATRPQVEALSAIAIDDVTIWPCKAFYRDCKRTPSGQEYRGNRNTYPNEDQPCQKWSEFYSDMILKDLDHDEDLVAIQDRCRMMNSYEEFSPGPFCLLKHYPHWADCNVPYCECDDYQFQCLDGRCIPASVTCNGIDDCGDNSDEEGPCENRGVTCQFQDDYICGYRQLTEFHWKRTRGHDFGGTLAPQRDYKGSVTSYFLYADAPLGVEGDKAYVESPATTILANQCLTFYLYLRLNPNGTEDTFRIHLRDSDRPDNKWPTLYEISKWNQTAWQYMAISIPEGSYNIIFEFQMGFPSLCAAAIDHVHIQECQPDMDAREGVLQRGPAYSESLDCDFSSGDTCSYQYHGDQSLSIWSVIPESYYNEAGHENKSVHTCEMTLYSNRGFVNSPGFPGLYPSNYNSCLAEIVGPPGSHITLDFVTFNVEPSSNYSETQCDYDRVELFESKNKTDVVVLCDSSYTTSTFTTTSNRLFIHMTTDYNMRFAGFRARYSVTAEQEAAYVMALSYNGPKSKVNRLAEMFSPITERQEIGCLSFDFRLADGVALSVISSGEHSRGLFDWKTINQSEWNHVKRAIPAGNFQIVFRVKYDGLDPGFKAAFDNISFVAGECFDNYVEGSINCDFNTSGNRDCGYFDASDLIGQTGITFWHRKGIHYRRHDTNDTYFQRVSLVVHTADFVPKSAILIVPMVHYTVPHCLQMMYSTQRMGLLSFDFFLFYDNDLQGPSKTLGSLPVTPDYEDGQSYYGASSDLAFKGLVDMPHGSYRLMIRLGGRDLQSIAIHSMEVSPGKCRNPSRANEIAIQKTTSNVMRITRPEDIQGEPRTSSNSGRKLSSRGNDFNYKVPPTTRKQIGDFFTMSDLLVRAGHQQQDLVHSCTFDGKPCPNGSIAMEATDFGSCHTFNGRRDSPFQSYKPGAGHGLKLTLNIEQYEHILGPHTDAGVKIHLHDQNDIPSVSDLGIAASLSSHTFLDMRYQKTIEVGKPYGSCEDTPLEIYKHESYSRRRCILECNTKTLVEMCGCKNHYMDGDYPFCSISQYMDCVVTNWTSSPNKSDCNCTSACEQAAFAIAPSSTILSQLGVKQLLIRDTNMLEKRYARAIDIHHRFDPESISTVLSQLKGITDATQELGNFIHVLASSSFESPMLFAHKSLQDLDEMMLKDIDVAFQNVSKYIEAFESSRDIGFNLYYKLTRQIIEILGFAIAAEDERLPNVTGTQGTIENKLNELHDLCVMRKRCMYFFDMNAPASKYLPTNAYIDADQQAVCQRAYQNESTIDSLLHWLIEPGQANQENYTQVMRDVLNQTIIMERNMKQCFNFYSDLLYEIQNWLQEAKVSHSKTLDGSYDLELMVQGYTDLFGYFIDNIYVKFISHDITVKDLTAITMTEQFPSYNDFYHVLMAFQESIGEKISSVIKQNVIEMKKRVPKVYLKALDLLSTLEAHFGYADVTMTPWVKGLQIWRKPFYDPNGDAALSFALVENEGFMAWPAGADMAEFKRVDAPAIFRQMNALYFDTLLNSIRDAESLLDKHCDKILKVVHEFYDHLTQEEEKLRIDEKFIMNNFLTLDIYYGELSHRVVEMTPSYLLESFFSDLGGNMGLLMGLSAISIFEILDLIIYNSFRKVLTYFKTKGKDKQADRDYIRAKKEYNPCGCRTVPEESL